MSDVESFSSANDSSALSFYSCDDSFNDSVRDLHQLLKGVFTSFNNSLNICHINAQSIPSHYTELEASFSPEYIHAILVSESWLKPSLPSTLYPLPGFVLVRNDRVGKGGGGVAIYLHASIPHKIVLASPSCYSASSEFLFVELDVKGIRMLLGVVYCPPSTDYFATLDMALVDICSEYTHCIIMGDFNTDLLKNSPRSKKLLSIVESVNLSILPLKATHHNIGTDDSLIDLIFAASPDRVMMHGQLPALGISRHDLVYASYKLKPPKYSPSVLHLRSFSKIDFDKLKNDALKLDLTSFIAAPTVDDKVSILNHNILSLYDAHAPVRKVRLKRSPAPWMTEGVRLAMSRRNRAFLRFKRERTEENWLSFKAARNRCNQMVRAAKRRYFHNCINNSSPAEVWKFLRSFGLCRPATLDCGPSLSLDEINHHFASVKAMDPTIRSQTVAFIASVQFPNIPTFNFSPVSQDDVKKSILAIQSKAVGYDEISRHMVVFILEHLLPAISHIINFSLDSGQYPNLWKRAFIKPLPKVPTPILPNHFRPISILPFLSKILESCVYKQISTFVSKYNLLSIYQSGFRPGHSTTTALINVTDDIRQGMEGKKVTVLVLVDFSNAFNTVDHEILLSILSHLNFGPTALDWFASYLRGRQQSVCVGQMTSAWADVEAGVPQGGILSPIIFSIFINFITSIFDCSYHMYADDLQLYVQAEIGDVHNGIKKLNDNLSALKDWSTRFGVLVNPLKCQAILVGSSRMLAKINLADLPPIYYNGITIPFCKSVKNLGLHIDSTLNWRTQVSEVSRKVIATLRSLYRLKHFLPTKSKIMLVQSLILPIIDYADVCYPDLSQDLLNKLERLLNNCIRFIFGLRKYDHISQYRSKLNWLTIRERRSSRILLVLFSILNDPFSPSYLKSKFHYLSSSHDRVLRSSSNNRICIPVHFTEFYGSSFTVQAARLWNSLPDDIRKAPNKFAFKKLVRNHLLKTTLYT